MLRHLSLRSGSYLRAAVDLCFPPKCLSCNTDLNDSRFLFCEDCFGLIDFVGRPYCLVCGTVFAAGDNHLCGHCLQKGWSFDRARGIVVYNETMAAAILDFKFGGRKAALQTFAGLKKMSPFAGHFSSHDLIIPVPLHIKRLRQRGFNQALLLARCFFPDRRDIVRTDILLRRKNTIPQTGLDGVLRRKNLKNAFYVADPQMICGRRILLIDDVFTTGTTVNECAKMLKKEGAAEVDVLTLARVIK